MKIDLFKDTLDKRNLTPIKIDLFNLERKMSTSKRVMKMAEKQVKNKKTSKSDKIIAEDVIKKGKKDKKKGK